MRKITTKLPAGKILEIKELSDGTFEVVQEVVEEVAFIEAEELSLNDRFMKHKPCTKAEERAKQLIAEAIKAGVKNFYRPIMDPSFVDDGISYIAGKKPAIGKSYNWWVDTAKNYNPSRNSRLGTRLEYGAFLGVLIKKLVEEGMTVKWAWNAVCNDSKELGHYRDSENAKHEFETTGSRCICGFYDLANTCKILSEDGESSGYWVAGGYYVLYGIDDPIADLEHNVYGSRSILHAIGVGWIVLS